MSYTALYRKWRPVSFEDVKGQDPIVQTLKNQITSERIGHAYLFCGTRGTGKTSIAKIFARAVNCEHPVDGSPCNECPTCRSIQSGSSMNVVEIDAASNNGVDCECIASSYGFFRGGNFGYRFERPVIVCNGTITAWR